MKSCSDIVKESLQLLDDPILYKCRSGAEFLLTRISPLNDCLNNVLEYFNEYIAHGQDLVPVHENFANLLKYLNSFANLTSETVIYGKVVSLTAANINEGEGKIIYK